MMRWADRWIVGLRSLHLTHAADRGEVVHVLRCFACGEEVSANDVHYRPADAEPAAE
jgi:hypothetical protein